MIAASSLGTVFEWYDFYLYGLLATIISAQFFSGRQRDHRLHPRARRLRRGLRGAAVRRAGVRADRRPRRAQVHLPRHHGDHGRLDLRGRPAAELRQRPASPRRCCWSALRLLQGLALGGQYGGAATYVAEHAPDGKRGFYTSFIQTTATLGLFAALLRGDRRCARRSARRPSPAGAGACRSSPRRCCCWSRCGSASSSTRARCSQKMKAEREDLEGAADRGLRQCEEPAAGAGRVAGRGRRAGGASGTPDSSTRCSTSKRSSRSTARPPIC